MFDAAHDQPEPRTPLNQRSLKSRLQARDEEASLRCARESSSRGSRARPLSRIGLRDLHDPSTPPIRVLLIAPSLDILGGQAVQATRLLAQFTKERSLQVSFLPINPRLKGPLRRLQSVKYVRTVTTFSLYVPLLLASIPRYEIVHIFSAAYWSYGLWTLPAILIARLLRRKVIVNYRSGEAEDHLANWRMAIPSIRLADQLVAPSRYLVDVFARFGLRMRSIPNILDMERFRFRDRRPLRPVFMTNRGLEPLYNVGCVLRAFHIVQQRFPEASLTVAHDGVCRPKLEQLAKQLDLRNARFIGRVPQDRIPELYDAADIYLTSPDLDCMPGSILECFASGLPVVATNAGGIPYMVKDEETGLLVDRSDYRAMAASAIRLLDDEALVTRITRRAYEECEKYDGLAVRKQWLELYRGLARVNAS